MYLKYKLFGRKIIKKNQKKNLIERNINQEQKLKKI